MVSARARWRVWSKRALYAAAVALLLLGAACLWLLRDPRPHFEQRRGTLEQATLEDSAEHDGHLEQLVSLRSSSGLQVALAIKRPLGPAPAGGRPLAVLLGGQETGRDALRLVPGTRGAIAVALSWPYDGPKRPKGWAVLGAMPRIRAGLLDTPPAIQLALDWLLAQPDVDPARVELVGVSLGAPLACVAGALDTRVVRVWSVHGGADPYRLIENGLRPRIGWAPARHLVTALACVAGNLPGIAPERWVGAISPRAFVQVDAADDERIPQACKELLWAAAREPRERIVLPGAHVEPDREEIVRGLVALVLERVTAAD